MKTAPLTPKEFLISWLLHDASPRAWWSSDMAVALPFLPMMHQL
jgi:hypothetical protein